MGLPGETGQRALAGPADGRAGATDAEAAMDAAIWAELSPHLGQFQSRRGSETRARFSSGRSGSWPEKRRSERLRRASSDPRCPQLDRRTGAKKRNAATRASPRGFRRSCRSLSSISSGDAWGPGLPSSAPRARRGVRAACHLRKLAVGRCCCWRSGRCGGGDGGEKLPGPTSVFFSGAAASQREANAVAGPASPTRTGRAARTPSSKRGGRTRGAGRKSRRAEGRMRRRRSPVPIGPGSRGP